MQIDTSLPDDAILAEIGQRLQQHRLDLELTQAELAEQSGVSKRTVERLEAGKSVQLGNLIRVLRTLDLLTSLDGLAPESGPRPIDLLKLKGKQRRRARSKHNTGQPAQTWQWGKD